MGEKQLIDALGQAEQAIKDMAKVMEVAQNTINTSINQARRTAVDNIRVSQDLQMAEIQLKNMLAKAKKGEDVSKDIAKLTKKYNPNKNGSKDIK